jgi:hypothetical protein
MGIAVTKTIATSHSVPKIADWMPASSGKLEGKLVMKSRSSLDQPQALQNERDQHDQADDHASGDGSAEQAVPRAERPPSLVGQEHRLRGRAQS